LVILLLAVGQFGCWLLAANI